MADAILAILIFSPLAITFLLKSNAALAFFSVCASFVVISLASADLKNLTGHLDLRINSSTLNLLLLVVPALLTLLFTRKSSKGKVMRAIQLAAALCVGGLLALSGVPMLAESVQANFNSSQAWTDLQKVQGAVVGAGVVLSLLIVWLGGLKHRSKKH